MKGKIKPFLLTQGVKFLNIQDKERIEGQFILYCLRVIENEARNLHRDIRLRKEKYKTFSDLSISEMDELSAPDTYFLDDQTFSVSLSPSENIKVVIVNSDLYDALRKLPKENLDLILQFYFLDKKDKEIAEDFQVVQSSVCRRRHRILKLLKELIAKEGYL